MRALLRRVCSWACVSCGPPSPRECRFCGVLSGVSRSANSAAFSAALADQSACPRPLCTWVWVRWPATNWECSLAQPVSLQSASPWRRNSAFGEKGFSSNPTSLLLASERRLRLVAAIVSCVFLRCIDGCRIVLHFPAAAFCPCGSGLSPSAPRRWLRPRDSPLAFQEAATAALGFQLLSPLRPNELCQPQRWEDASARPSCLCVVSHGSAGAGTCRRKSS